MLEPLLLANLDCKKKSFEKIKVRSTRIEYFKWPTRKILSKIHYIFTIYDWSRIQITHQDIGEIEKSSGMHCIYGFQFAVCKYVCIMAVFK